MRKRLVGYLIGGLCIIFSSGKGYSASWYVCSDPVGLKNGTSWSNCWGDFNEIVWGINGVHAGDTIFLDGGTSGITYTKSLTVGASGTSDNSRITIKVGQDVGHNGKVTFDFAGTVDGWISISGKEYITIDGENNGGIGIVIQNNLKDPNTTTRHVVNARESKYCKIKYIEVYNVKDGINLMYTTRVEISDSYIHGIKNDAAIVAIGNPDSFNLTWGGQSNIHHNRIEVDMKTGTGCGPDGIQATGWAEIHHNTFTVGSSNRTDIIGCQHSDIIQTASANEYVKIYSNTWRGCPQYCLYMEPSAFDDPIRHLWIYNNLFDLKGVPGSGGAILSINNGPIDDFIFSNNTFVDANKSGSYNCLYFAAYNKNFNITNSAVKNNIFHNCGEGSSDRSAWFNMSLAQVNQLNVDYNVLSPGTNGDSDIIYGTAGSANIYTQPHQKTGNVSFITYTKYGGSNNNYTPSLSDKIAKDQGISMSPYYSEDIIGKSRPLGVAWDIGAYELDVKIPLPPKDIYVK